MLCDIDNVYLQFLATEFGAEELLYAQLWGTGH